MGERKIGRDQEIKVNIMFARKILVILLNIKIIKVLRRLYLKRITILIIFSVLACCRKIYGFMQWENLAQFVART